MQKEEIKAVWDHYKEGKASDEEIALLESWYLGYEHPNRAVLTEEQINGHLDAISVHLPLATKPVRLWPGIAAAASLIVVLGTGWWIYSNRNINAAGRVQIVNAYDPAPGKNTATLTLANGKTITLSDAKHGVIVGGKQMMYNDSSSVMQLEQDQPPIERGIQLTASTPRGGQYQITLPDGTRVWLNAATSIQFPQSFEGVKERRVILNGEAYFEVAKDKVHPFIVKTTAQEVKVLGTHFNINSYSDEHSTKTTLLEGSVQVLSRKTYDTEFLKPGQQAILQNGANRINITDIDTEQAIAWKNGVFQFYRADLKTVMRELARWYNVDVSYQGNIPDHEFTGKIFKRVNVSAALTILSELGLNFKIEGRKITVSP